LEEVTGRAMNMMGPDAVTDERHLKKQKMDFSAFVIEEQRNAAVR
jgi:hypothetical protein